MKKLIDVSTHQGVIDWEKAKPHIDGAILRCGYGSDIEKQDDAQFKRNADECTRLGIPFGVYIYSYADSIEKAKSEAAHVLRLIKGYKLSYPVYLDLEESKTIPGMVDRANAFGDIIEAAGYWCGVYSSLYWWNTHLKGLDRFTKWVAQWNKTCDYKGSSLDMWQYTDSGKIDGIRGGVDMNECYRDFSTEIQNAKPEKTIDELAEEVIAGLWGTGEERKTRLGDKYESVQKRVNEILLGKPSVPTKSIDELAREVIAGKHGNGEERRKSLGDQYDAVQKRVNELLK